MIKFTIAGVLSSMKNRRIPSKHNPRVTIVNADCKAFERGFAYQLPRSARRSIGSLEKPLRTKVIVYYPSMRSDLDAAWLYDLLQKYGVVRNDRYIREKTEIARVDKSNPRVEIEIYEAGECG